MLGTSPIIALIVTYQPDLPVLAALLAAVLPQVDAVVVVDNGSKMDIASWLSGNVKGDKVHCLGLGENLGIAVAQNAGIDWAERQRAGYVLLLDQDSRPASDMVDRLLAAAEKLTAEGNLVAVVGPRHEDARSRQQLPFVRLRGLRLEICKCDRSGDILPVDHVIASGSLIPMTVLAAVGGKTESLFIDYVDIEWCLRAKSLGYQTFVACNARMAHNLGEKPVRFLGHTFSVHSPLRRYYQFRNAVWMVRQSWLPFGWKFAISWKLLYKYGIYTLLARPWRTHQRMMALGFWHGMRGCTGRCPLDEEG
ncbi:MAG: glycosyltransferase family 2 protein [Proteobacteria bacterium]|nr:glycosyltransferase family 2 protein [Pseudomonadota bacterium]MBU4295735.1 glycosyltransferase family 2 protein [Pseudomonadota bacterium]